MAIWHATAKDQGAGLYVYDNMDIHALPGTSRTMLAWGAEFQVSVSQVRGHTRIDSQRSQVRVRVSSTGLLKVRSNSTKL